MPTMRQARRYPFRVPLKLRHMDSRTLATRGEFSGNISCRGVYLESAFPYKVGERIEVTLEMPEAVGGSPPRKWTCHGRIVHTQAAAGSPAGAGIEFLYYEVSRAASPRRDFDLQYDLPLPAA